MTPVQIINQIIEGLAFFMLFMAIMISISSTVNQMITIYKWQSAFLAAIVLITAALPLGAGNPFNLLTRFFLFIFTAIPITLIIIIEPLLAQATVPEDVSARNRIQHLFNSEVRANARRNAYPVWLAQHPSARRGVGSIAVNLFLMVLAFIVAYNLMKDSHMASILAISFSLLLLGLSIMRAKQDIISQIMGLLVMEHGMFLAVIRLVQNSYVILTLVISLLLYILITFTILIFLLPDLHRISRTIDIDRQEELKG